ncbi:MAG: NADPH-dependent assimilatory sulfite reductase hemoprotein subunit [Myxococcales bacterium]|nr:NADPH-dependent assimilatory sulfite reductase hemoprotein subunit [Myxococcales bacterium]
MPPKPPVTLIDADPSQMSKVEQLKSRSEGLFFVAPPGRDADTHAFGDELDAMTRGAAETIGNEAKELSKHFGIYKQQERGERGRKTGDYIFMVRVKLPAGGELSPEQWVALDGAADRFANQTLRLTTRQGIQLHYIPGRKLGALIRYLNEEVPDRGYRLTTLGACGDLNRNTMCSPIDDLDPELPLCSRELAHEIARELAPRTSSYFQIFLSDDEARSVAPMTSEEPIYGTQYLPRKFKVGIAHPHDNSIDLLTQDVGLLPVLNGREVESYDLYTGGGLGITHHQPQTKQLLGIYLGRIPRAQVTATVRSIVTLQKEHGERRDRRQARWKYTLRRLGPDRVKEMLRSRFEIDLEEATPGPIPPVCYHLGWNREAGDGDRWWLGLPVENGRMRQPARRAVREVVEELGLGVRITPNQDLLLCHVPGDRRAWVDERLRQDGVAREETLSTLRTHSFACPAKPTCGLAMTDAENVLPRYLAELEAQGLGDVDVIIRMAGCPNGCSRPPTAEIGIYGYGKNDHVIQVGGSREGTRIGKVLYERVPEEQMVPVLAGLLRAIRDHSPDALPPGEFLHRTPGVELKRLVGVEA